MAEEKRKYSVEIENKKEAAELIQRKDKCDKYDYLAAVGCGAIGGLIDIFLVGTPTDSVLGKWTDSQVNKAVNSFAKLSGWDAQSGSAIAFLERKYKVNYDQRYGSDVGDLFDMNTRNHHMKSLAHSPDIIGLFFSVLAQFTSTATFVSEGRMITVDSEFNLQGRNFIAKIFCGIANWFGHIMSDIAGASGSVGRGAGVVIPFYELFGACKIGNFRTDKGKQDLATIATRAFEEGYDFRFGLAMAIPVIVTDLTIKLIWSIRRYFQYGYTLKECIPSKKHDDLRIMLLIGNGMLCIMDAIDAGVHSGGNFVSFFLRLNLIAWFKLVMMVLKEVCIRVGIKDALLKQIEAYKRINEALQEYLNELERIDIKKFRKETESYNKIVKIYWEANSDEELNRMLSDTMERLGLNKPWKGDFNEHMSNKNGTLVFG